MSAGAKASRIRDAAPIEVPQVVAIDTTAAAGDSERRAAIERWIAAGSMRVAVAADEIVGYQGGRRCAGLGRW